MQGGIHRLHFDQSQSAKMDTALRQIPAGKQHLQQSHKLAPLGCRVAGTLSYPRRAIKDDKHRHTFDTVSMEYFPSSQHALSLSGSLFCLCADVSCSGTADNASTYLAKSLALA